MADGAELLHLIDASGPAPDALYGHVASRDGRTVRRSLDSWAARQRLAFDLRRMRADTLVVWSPRALSAAKRAGAKRLIYRPRAHATRVPAGAANLFHCHAQRRRCGGGGAVVPAPVPPAEPVTRRELDAGDDDFLWLLSADAGPGADLPTATWAGALLHVLMRHAKGRRQRLLLPGGDAARLTRARRFADQLGLQELAVPVTTLPYARLAASADGAVFAANGPVDPWPMRLARAAGLACVAADCAETREVFAGYDAVRLVDGGKPRHLTRAMLDMADAGGGRTPRAVAGEVETAAELYRRVVSP